MTIEDANGCISYGTGTVNQPSPISLSSSVTPASCNGFQDGSATIIPQGGTSPYIVDKHFDEVNVDPYGIKSPEYQTTEAFNEMWCSALAHCQKRFEGKSHLYRKGPSGGLGCMTPDSFPIFDRFLENVYMIADANHGYKMIGVGELVAKEILGQESDLLKPFRFNRYEKGELHPTSNSPFPWS